MAELKKEETQKMVEEKEVGSACETFEDRLMAETMAIYMSKEFRESNLYWLLYLFFMINYYSLSISLSILIMPSESTSTSYSYMSIEDL